MGSLSFTDVNLSEGFESGPRQRTSRNSGCVTACSMAGVARNFRMKNFNLVVVLSSGIVVQKNPHFLSLLTS
jgi:hypothetical protein